MVVVMVDGYGCGVDVLEKDLLVVGRAHHFLFSATTSAHIPG